jgi:hypothetical protein
LEVGQEAAARDSGNFLTDTALFFRLPSTRDGISYHRAFPTYKANFHYILLIIVAMAMLCHGKTSIVSIFQRKTRLFVGKNLVFLTPFLYLKKCRAQDKLPAPRTTFLSVDVN